MGSVKIISHTPIFLLLLLCGPLAAQQPAKKVPDFRFTTLDSRAFTNTDLPKDKMLLFVFFDPDCEHCRHALKTMDQQHTAFQKAAVYLVSTASHDKINLFMATYARQLRQQKNVLLLQDPTSTSVMRFNPIRYPSLFLYSSEKSLLDYEDNEDTIFRIEKFTK
jgi:hypothetical protein